jgi:hypothetical protein
LTHNIGIEPANGGRDRMTPFAVHPDCCDTKSRDRMCEKGGKENNTWCIPTIALRERAGCAQCNRCEASRTMYRIGLLLATGRPIRKLHPVKG